MPRERRNLVATMAGVTALTLCIGLIGAWAASRSVRPVTHLSSGVLSPSPSRSPSPSPIPTEPPPPVSPPSSAQVVAPSTNVVWVLMDYDGLYLSTDKGSIWDPRSLPNSSGGMRPIVSFINGHDGWLLMPGLPGTQCEEATSDLWHTTDGAASWQHLTASGIAKSQCKDGIWFIDTKRGFVTASDPNHPPTIYRTVDGGSTWMPATLPDPPDFKSSAGGFTLDARWIKAFGTTLYLEATGAQDTGPHDRYYLFRSTDGGATWSWLTKVPPLPSLAMVTESRWLILAGGGLPQETLNGGQQWHPYTTDLNLDSPVAGETQIVFADANVGYEMGRGAMQWTSSGGAHWSRLPPLSAAPPVVTTVVLSAPSANAVWALVTSSNLFRSTDRGGTWAQRSVPNGHGTEASLLTFVDDTTGFVLFRSQTGTGCTDQNAELWETTDGAITWHVVATAAPSPTPTPRGLPFSECKDAMYFADSKHGWLATGNAISAPTIWRTSDGGLTWDSSAPNDPRLNQQLGGPAPRVSEIASYGSTVLVDVAPYIFRSTNGGASWAYVTSSPSMSAAVGFVTASRWIELTSPDNSSETTAAGASWHTFHTDYEQAVTMTPQIVFADANIGYATVRGEVSLTLNGGLHWDMIKTSWP